METPENLNLTNGIHHDTSPLTLDVKRCEVEGENFSERTRDCSSRNKLCVSDFEVLGFLGRGSYSEVSLVRRRSSNTLFAMKVIDKAFLKRERKQHQVFVERQALTKMSHPNIVKLHSTFQDKAKLYFVLDYLGGGTFAEYLAVYRRLNIWASRYYTAEMVTIIEHVHSHRIAHRDLKPSNLMLSEAGHLTLIDFGTAKLSEGEQQNLEEETHACTPLGKVAFVGTAEYIAPELLEKGETGPASDLWALGCILFEMLVGCTPFAGDNEYIIFENILRGEVTFPMDFNADAKDFIAKLLEKHPEERLGVGKPGSKNDFAALKKHPFFDGIDFENFEKYESPYSQIASPFRDNRSGSNSPMFPSTFADMSGFSDQIREEVSKKSACVLEPKIVLKGTITKKSGWFFYRTRIFVLFSDGQLEYYDPDLNVLKAKMKLTKESRVEIENKTRFSLQIGSKIFQFKDSQVVCQQWVEALCHVIASLN